MRADDWRRGIGLVVGIAMQLCAGTPYMVMNRWIILSFVSKKKEGCQGK